MFWVSITLKKDNEKMTIQKIIDEIHNQNIPAIDKIKKLEELKLNILSSNPQITGITIKETPKFVYNFAETSKKSNEEIKKNLLEDQDVLDAIVTDDKITILTENSYPFQHMNKEVIRVQDLKKKWVGKSIWAQVSGTQEITNIYYQKPCNKIFVDLQTDNSSDALYNMDDIKNECPFPIYCNFVGGIHSPYKEYEQIEKHELLDKLAELKKELIGKYGIFNVYIENSRLFVEHNQSHNAIKPFIEKTIDKLVTNGTLIDWSSITTKKESKLKMPIVAALSLLIGVAVEFTPIPSKTIIHEGVLKKGEVQANGNNPYITKIDGDITFRKYVFEDGSSFILEDSEISGIIPKGCKTKLCQGIFGNYYFEVQK